MSKCKLIFLFFALVSSTAFADTYFIENVKGNGIADTDKDTVRELVSMAVSQSGKHHVVTKQGEADFSLHPTLMKLGDAYILSLQKKNKSGEALFTEKMKATSLSEMDNVAGRLTNAVISQTTAASTADVTNITSDEELMNSRRYNATRQWVVGLGPGWTSNLNSKGGGFTLLIGYNWGLDPDYSINLDFLAAGGPGNDNSHFSRFSLGAEYYLSRTKFSPFAGASLGYGSSTINDNSCITNITCSNDHNNSGWAMSGRVGYKMFRTSSVNAAVMLDYSALFAGNVPGLTTVLFAVYF